MNAREYLKGLNEHDPVWDMAEEFEYTEDQLINFAERYHEKQLKLLRIGVVSNHVFCPHCGDKLQLKVETDLNSGRGCKSALCKDK